jgi:pilus assembly protein CpaE
MEKPGNKLTEIPLAASRPADLHGGRDLGNAAVPSLDYSNVTDVNPSVVLIAPNDGHLRNIRRALQERRATILREFSIYPGYAHLSALLEADCDAFVVEIDSDMEAAMDLVEAICARKPSVTVIVYSTAEETDRMARSMRAGAREFLSGAISPNVLQEALVRAAARRSEQTSKKVRGKIMVFWGAKGGSGVTMLAANFAIALRMETVAEVALLDLNPHLGDVALLLGVTPRFTVVDALQNAKRLDQDFISTLVTEHASGVSILASPDAYTSAALSDKRTVGKLVEVFSNQYPYVVIDAGRGLGDGAEPLFQMASTIYLVTELDIPSLRNTQRFISYVERIGNPHIELVVNRFDARKTEFNDERVAKALGVPPKWKIPNDYAAVHRSLNSGSPLIMEKSPVAQALRAMARAASGRPRVEGKKKSWGLFN